MFGYETGELIGHPLTLLMPHRFDAAHRADFERFLRTREARVIGHAVELAGVRKDGREFPVELSLAVCDTSDGPFFTGIIRDLPGAGVRRRISAVCSNPPPTPW